MDRRLLDFISVAEAAERLRIRRATARQIVSEARLVNPLGKVLWAQVVQHVRRAQQETATDGT